MLTPSLAGALMGISSLGVMANSLLLQLEYKRRQMQPGLQVKQTQELTTLVKDYESNVDVEKGLPFSQTPTRSS
jgi:hypothetical protein